MNIEFSTTEIGFDVVPAFQDPDNPELYEIPDRNLHVWIRTNPRKHNGYSVERNRMTDGKAKPLVKMLKCWNGGFDDKPMRSFHLEILVYQILSSPPDSYPQGLADLFAALAERVTPACSDPVGLGPDIDIGISLARRTRARQLLLDAAATARTRWTQPRLVAPRRHTMTGAACSGLRHCIKLNCSTSPRINWL